MKTTTNLLNRVGESVGRYRWVICSLLFFATTINYLDRAVIGLLKETLTITAISSSVSNWPMR